MGSVLEKLGIYQQEFWLLDEEPTFFIPSTITLSRRQRTILTSNQLVTDAPFTLSTDGTFTKPESKKFSLQATNGIIGIKKNRLRLLRHHDTSYFIEFEYAAMKSFHLEVFIHLRDISSAKQIKAASYLKKWGPFIMSASDAVRGGQRLVWKSTSSNIFIDWNDLPVAQNSGTSYANTYDVVLIVTPLHDHVGNNQEQRVHSMAFPFRPIKSRAVGLRKGAEDRNNTSGAMVAPDAVINEATSSELPNEEPIGPAPNDREMSTAAQYQPIATADTSLTQSPSQRVPIFNSIVDVPAPSTSDRPQALYTMAKETNKSKVMAVNQPLKEAFYFRITMPQSQNDTDASENRTSISEPAPVINATCAQHLIAMPGGVYHQIRIFGKTNITKKEEPTAPVVAPEQVIQSESGTGTTEDEAEEKKNDVDEQEDEEDVDCLICLSEPKDTIVFPCRHMCVCRDCANELSTRTAEKKCPVCRNPIVAMLHIKNNNNSAEETQQQQQGQLETS